MFGTLTKTWSLRAYGPSLQAHSSLIGRKILCRTLGTLMAAPLGLSVCRRSTSENFTSTLMLTQLAL